MSHATPASDLQARTRHTALALLVAAVVLLYAPVAGFDFLNLDDQQHILLNPWVAGGLRPDGIAWALTSTGFDLWMPVTWLSLMLDATLFGSDPAGFHLVNVALHALNCVLLERALRGLPLAAWQRLAGVALFALHPQHVEVVAWVIERKELLAMSFGLASWLAYARWAERGGAGLYLLALAAYLLSLAAKPMWVSWPLLLLLIDWVQGRLAGARRWRAVGGVLPFLGVALLVTGLTLAAAQANGSLARLESYTLGERLPALLAAYAFYLDKSFFPVGLSTYVALGSPQQAGYSHWLGLAGLLAGSAVAWRLRYRNPLVAVGWCWFVLALFPVSGISQVGSHWVADRYSYLPHIGLFVAVAALLRRPAAVAPRRLLLAAGLVLAALAWLSGQQLPAWRNSETFWRQSLAVSGESAYVHYQYGNYFLDTGRPGQAAGAYRRAHALEPRTALYLLLLANAELRAGHPEALDGALHRLRALGIDPEDLARAADLGSELVTRGAYRAAHDLLGWLTAAPAVQRDPLYPRLLMNLGAAQLGLGDRVGGLAVVRRALDMDAALAERACRAWRHGTQAEPLARRLLAACE